MISNQYSVLFLFVFFFFSTFFYFQNWFLLASDVNQKALIHPLLMHISNFFKLNDIVFRPN